MERRNTAVTKVILDQTTESRFTNLSDRAEICDHQGRTIGIFIPVVGRALYGRVPVPFTEEELDRFEQEPGGRPLADILADLEKKP
jgi:hypothetical protein